MNKKELLFTKIKERDIKLEMLKNNLQDLQEQLKKMRQEYYTLLDKKIKFNGKVKFKDNLRIFEPMGIIQIFNVKDKIFDIKDGFIELIGTEKSATTERKIRKKIYWENIKDKIEILEIYEII